MNNSFVAGVDIGGSHITAAMVNLTTSTLVPGSSARSAIATGDPAEKIITAWCNIISSAFTATPGCSRKIGIAMPGPFDYEQGICFIKDQGKYEALYGMPVKAMMAAELGIRVEDIRMMNDALCFLQGEVAGGAVSGYSSALGLTLGTGLGSAIYQKGVTEDADLWHTPFREGIAEDYLASRWFVKRYEEVSGRAVANTKELVELIPSDPSIKSLFEEFSDHLAQFLSGAIIIHQPEVIVLGGNIAKSYRLFLPTLESRLKELGVQVPLRIAMLGENAHIIGAAGCWKPFYV